jgi:hypothetical protein
VRVYTETFPSALVRYTTTVLSDEQCLVDKLVCNVYKIDNTVSNNISKDITGFHVSLRYERFLWT